MEHVTFYVDPISMSHILHMRFIR